MGAVSLYWGVFRVRRGIRTPGNTDLQSVAFDHSAIRTWRLHIVIYYINAIYMPAGA